MWSFNIYQMYHLMLRKVWRKLLHNIKTRILEGDSFTFHHVRGDVTGGRDEMCPCLFGHLFPKTDTSSHCNEKTTLTFHYTGWLIGILILAYSNPYITG